MIKKNLKKFIIGLIVLIVVIVAVILIVNLTKKDKKSDISDITKSESFFLEDKEGNYALFNEDGKQLTDFIFFSVDSSIINGATRVENSNGDYGILSEDGKMIVDFGDYNYINHVGALYKVTDKEYKSYLLNSSGKQIGSLEGFDIDVFESDDLFVIIETDNEYNVLNYNGKNILTLKKVSGEDDPIINNEENYLLIFYNKTNYIINLLNDELVLSFESEQNFCIKDINENDNGDFILNSCSYNAKNEEKYKLVRDGKIVYETNNYLSYDNGGNVILSTSDGKVILDENGTETIVISGLAYYNSSSYAKLTNGSFDGVDIYNNGSIVTHIDCRGIEKTGYMSEGIYILNTYYSKSCGTTSGKRQYYKADGTLLNDEEYAKAGEFDDNHLARVSQDKKNYYLINSKGEKVTDDYSNIGSNQGEYYIATKEDDSNVIINTKGEELISGDAITFSKSSNKLFASIRNGKKYTIYSIEDKKELTVLESEPTFKTHYFMTSQDGKKQYYSYKNGKMFYES